MKALGLMSIDVGLTFMNLSVIQQLRGDMEKALEYDLKCIEIFEVFDLILETD